MAIRPKQYIEKRVPYPELTPTLSRTAVDLRGWDFPHIDPHTPISNLLDHISQESSWSHFHEVWRFYQSGQFVDLSGQWEDWRDETQFFNTPQQPPTGWQAGTQIGIGEALYRFTEIFEFASRLCLTAAGDDVMNIKVVLRGLKGRQLVNDDPRRSPLRVRQTAMEEFPFERDYERALLTAKARELALEPAAEFFERFDWTPGVEHLRGWQERIDRV